MTAMCACAWEQVPVLTTVFGKTSLWRSHLNKELKEVSVNLSLPWEKSISDRGHSESKDCAACSTNSNVASVAGVVLYAIVSP